MSLSKTKTKTKTMLLLNSYQDEAIKLAILEPILNRLPAVLNSQ